MPRFLRPLLPIVIFASVVGAPLPLADAASTQYLVTGELGVGETSSRLDNADFAFRLNFDEPAVPDFDLLGFAPDTQPFVAETWSLDLFDGSGPLSRYDQDSNRANLGFAIFTGEVTGLDTGDSTIGLGVDTKPADRRVDARDTLIEVEFFTGELVNAFFTNELSDLPDDTVFVAGSVLDLGSGLRVPIANSTLVVAELDDPVFVQDDTAGEAPVNAGNSGGPGAVFEGDPAAVPTPGAAVGGLLLMLLLVVRQLDRTQHRGEPA